MSGPERKLKRQNEKEYKKIASQEIKGYMEKSVEVYESIGKNMIPVGKCSKCGGVLFIYGASDFQNILNVYCTDCNLIEDARFPKKGDMIFIDNAELGLPERASFAEGVIALQRKEGALKDFNFAPEDIASLLATHAVSPSVNLDRDRAATMDL